MCAECFGGKQQKTRHEDQTVKSKSFHITRPMVLGGSEAPCQNITAEIFLVASRCLTVPAETLAVPSKTVFEVGRKETEQNGK